MFFICLFIIACVLQFFCQNIYFVYLAVVLFIIVIIDLLYSFISSRFISIEIEHDGEAYHVLDSVYLKIRLKSKLPVFKSNLLLKVENMQGGDKYRATIDINKETIHKNQFNSIGSYKFTIEKINIAGLCGGLFSFKKNTNASIIINVYPLPCQRKNVDLKKVEDHLESRKGKGDDYSEIYELRVYKPGDDFRHIHHRLSARNDDYIIKVGSDHSNIIKTYKIGEETMSSYETLLGYIYLQYLKASKTGSFINVAYKDKPYTLRTKYNFYSLCDQIYKEHERAC